MWYKFFLNSPEEGLFTTYHYFPIDVKEHEIDEFAKGWMSDYWYITDYTWGYEEMFEAPPLTWIEEQLV
jgi:hypothetical protein